MPLQRQSQWTFFGLMQMEKLCEHWDSIQQVPETLANPNKIYQ